MGLVFVILSVLVLTGSAAHAGGLHGCPNAKFSNPVSLSTKNASTVLVTHPSAAYDFSQSAKVGIDRLVAFGKNSGITSIYLQNSNLSDVYASDCDPGLWISSQAGEFSFLLSAETIFFGGGYWEACQDSTFSDVIRSWAVEKPKVARLIQVMDAIYVSGTYIYVWDEFYPRYRALIASKPMVAIPNDPTVTLSELMSILRDDAQRLEVLSRNLPNFGYLPAEYEVQLLFNGNLIRKLRPASSASNYKLLRVEFIETAP